MDEIILKDLPLPLVETAVRELAQYTVGFLKIGGTADGQPDLMGSGVLVSVGDIRAILTAHHVVRVIKKTEVLGLLLEKTERPHQIATHGAAFLEMDRGVRDSTGPDLGAVILAPSVASAVAAKKTFYNLDLRRDQMLSSPPGLRDGFWIAQGYLHEKTVVTPDPDGRGVTKSFYLFGGVGGPEATAHDGKYDYFEYPVEARQEAPVSWGGMSGGGLWQIPLKRQGNGLATLTPLLSGVLFYQQPTTATTCGVKCHGRRSVYEIAYNCICDRREEQKG